MSGSKSAEPSSRDKILAAAAAMIGEDPAARLSVRAVAARAGVNTGSLRHHFPTQRDLYDSVFSGILGLVAPGDPIRDTTMDPQVRLVECLRQVLALTGVGSEARQTWRRIYLAFIADEPTESTRSAFIAMEHAGQARIEAWLDVLVADGSLPAGDNHERATLLNTVVDGLSIGRALPTSSERTSLETRVLTAAVAGLFD
ncbi:TetR/AcrR family transcriptional regulator [Aeromicrobium sp. CF3.5]|uniref:TetR/AcrR family transcriptional regulator n=1 Tax=Aeromicrobium sp. CF3.5 TaxID=3373078 RepID=UPI003EE48387